MSRTLLLPAALETLLAQPMSGPGWREQVQTLEPRERALALAWADARYTQADGGREAGHAVYRALAPWFEPARAADHPRIQAVLDGASGAHEDLAPLWRRVLAAGPVELAAGAACRLGAIASLAGDLSQAEACYRASLSRAATVGGACEGSVLSSYAGFCVTTDREIEALVFARRSRSLLGAGGDPWRLAWLLWIEATVHAVLGDWPEELTLRTAFVAALARCGPRQRLRAAPEIARLEALHALGVGDAPRARAALLREGEAWEQLGGMLAPRRLLWTATWVRAVAQDGRPEEALDAALLVLAEPQIENPSLLALRAAIAQARLASGALHASEVAVLLPALRRAGAGAPGVAARARLAAGLAADLTRAGRTAEAHAAYDVAAGLALERLIELERFAREMPEIAQPAPADVALVTAQRRRLSGEARDLSAAVARLLRAPEHAEARRSLLPGPDALLAVCAWCQRVRLSDGRWLTVQQFLPLAESGPLTLTHGICPTCMAALLPVSSQARIRA